MQPKPNKKLNWGNWKRPKVSKPKTPGIQPIAPKSGDGMVYKQPFPGPAPYSPIKNTKQVNKVYKTY